MSALPRVGMMATLRNRRGLITSVEPFAGESGTRHLVRVEYTDPDGPPEDTVLWEVEHRPALTEPTALPQVAIDPPMAPAELDALCRATRWSALSPFLAPADPSQPAAQSHLAAPLFGAIQVEDFQLVPLLRALQMPRVSLLLADDVGLGKTMEAGLILSELLLRRRIRRVLILCPAALRHQWQREMHDKFSLHFDIVDRQSTHALQRRLGQDVNPWRAYSRIVTSYHYLRQPDVLEQFHATTRDQPPGSYELPWDLLIVDEAHNLMPASFGPDSDLSNMLRLISPRFEHKLFLTATPHNGHTRSFSGLLQQLDPVRFTQTSEFTAGQQDRIDEVIVRRLKSEINEFDASHQRPRRFPERSPDPLPLFFSRAEQELSRAVQELRKAVHALVSRRTADRGAGGFAIEVLNKRLLSSPSTFADSWLRFQQGLRDGDAATLAEVAAARRSSEEDIDDDQEREGRARHAARTVGAWLRPLLTDLAKPIAQVDRALEALGLRADPSAPGGVTLPKEDTRLQRLLDLIKKQLRQKDAWRSDERLIIFTEYKTTLDYLERRLRQAFKDDGQAIRVLYGSDGSSDADRKRVIAAFNDDSDPVRVLIATDAASEGLNLQETARLLLHYDIPWNPARLEQRNGRIDRHGQARDVLVYHFTSEDDADLRFLDHVVRKVHVIREELGSMGEVFDAAFQRRFLDQEDAERVQQSLDREVERRKGRAALPRRPFEREEAALAAADRLSDLRRDLDLSPATLHRTLEVALGMGFGQPRLQGPDARGRLQLRQPLPPRWVSLIDEHLRLPGRSGEQGALPNLIFDSQLFLSKAGERPVFRPTRDTVLLHLGHPLFRQALSAFARARFPGRHDGGSASRWTCRRADPSEIPAGATALLLLTVEELAVNELREPMHHWVRTLRIPLQEDRGGARLLAPLPYQPPGRPDSAAPADPPPSAAQVQRARALWDDVSQDIRALLIKLADERTAQMTQALKIALRGARKDEQERFTERIKEVERARSETTLARLEKEQQRLRAEMSQGDLFAVDRREKTDELRALEDELQRRRGHYEDLQKLLVEERARVLERLLPQRYALRGAVQVFPVTIELRLPALPA